MVDVLVDDITTRIEYTMGFIFEARGISYNLITDKELFQSSNNRKLYYGTDVAQKFKIDSCRLLFEKGVGQHQFDLGDFNGEECMVIDGCSDPIASIFFTLSRYEEYLSVQRDEHGRYPFELSVLQKWDWINKAVSDRWAEIILKFVGVEHHEIVRGVNLIPSFDIDNTYAYKLKKGKRQNLSIARDYLRLDWGRIKERKSVKRGGVDPYDTFDKIIKVARENEFTKVFWLVADLAPKDRNLSVAVPAHQNLIRKIGEVADVNLHPSYASNGEVGKLIEEKKRLESILETAVEKSRQHFLRFDLNYTYSNLEKTGFKHEFSMGFAESTGFRSGTARPHRWFDLKADRISELMIHPFSYMDGTLNEYMGLTTEESKELISQLYSEVDRFGGDFIFIWHNETIGDYGKWKGWSEVLEFTLKLKT